MNIKGRLIACLAIALYWAAPAHAKTDIQVPAECKNLALMQTQLLATQFHDNTMGNGTYNPSQLTLKTNNGYQIDKVEYLGGDGEYDDPKAGQYPCDKDPNLCTNPADAGGPIDWARVTVKTSGEYSTDIAQVIVSMGGRGGCMISSAKYIGQ